MLDDKNNIAYIQLYNLCIKDLTRNNRRIGQIIIVFSKNRIATKSLKNSLWQFTYRLIIFYFLFVVAFLLFATGLLKTIRNTRAVRAGKYSFSHPLPAG